MSPPRGFGVVGIIIAIEVLAILGHLALPLAREQGMRQRAARLVREIQVVRTAADIAVAQGGQWPEDGVPGRVPPSLTPFLPPAYSFQGPGYQLDWDYWRLSDGTDEVVAEGRFAAVSVITNDARLAGAVVGLLGSERPHLTIGNRSTLVLSEPFLPSQ